MNLAKFQRTLAALVTVKAPEVGALFISCAYFYLLLCAYYIIRPIRDEMVIATGVDNIQWLLLLTMAVLLLIAPLFGWITSRFKTRQFLSACTLFFASHLVIFYLLFDADQSAPVISRAFFIWVNVFNMFIVSLFWSFMNDVFSQPQSKRLFAFIAAGGTAGALTGPLITTLLVERIGLSHLLLISAILLTATVVCIRWLSHWNNIEYLPEQTDQKPPHRLKNESLKGGIWGGFTLILKSPYLLGICVFILLYAISITFVQIQQAELVAAAYSDPLQRTKLFSKIDLAVNALTLILQLFVTSRLIGWIGYRATLVLIPLGITIGFGLMAVMPVLAVMISLEIFRRSGDYAIMKPTREMLFSVVSREEKYKAKNFIDTAILRSGNTGSAWLYTGLRGAGAAGAGIAGISIALGIAWCGIAMWLGRQYQQRSGGHIVVDSTPRS